MVLFYILLTRVLHFIVALAFSLDSDCNFEKFTSKQAALYFFTIILIYVRHKP